MSRQLWVGGILLLFTSSFAWAQKQLVDRIVAVVNDEPITQSDLDRYLLPIYKDLKEGQQNEEELARQLNEIRLRLLNQIIEDRLVFQEAKTRGIAVEESEVEQVISEFKKQFPSEEEFEKTMMREGFSVGEIRENSRRQLIIRKLHDMEIRSRVVVSPREIEDYYQEHLHELSEREQIKLSSITVKKSEEAQLKGLADEGAKSRIEAIEKRLRAGEDFKKLAEKFSEDSRAKEGGMMDWLKRGEMLSSLEDVLFKLKVGEVSPVLETTSAYHLFKIEDKKASFTPALDDVRGKVYEILFQKKAREKFKEWMDELKSRAYITIR